MRAVFVRLVSAQEVRGYRGGSRLSDGGEERG